MGLERFWQRFNKAKLEEQALERERAALRERNRQLRELLGQYLARISVSRELLDEPDPLLAVQHKSCVPREPLRAGEDRTRAHRGDAHPDSSSGGDKSPDALHGFGGTSTGPPPAEQDPPPGPWGHPRDRDCLEVPGGKN